MHDFWKDLTWRQFGAAIDTLKNAIVACPDDLWGDEARTHQFWYLTFHTLFFLDFYLEPDGKNFQPPDPFTLSELDPAGVMPESVYSKDELLTYLQYGREKCQRTILALTEKRAAERFSFGRVDLSFAELLLYSLRHVQHHAAQLNMILRIETDSAPGWVFTADDE